MGCMGWAYSFCGGSVDFSGPGLPHSPGIVSCCGSLDVPGGGLVGHGILSQTTLLGPNGYGHGTCSLIVGMHKGAQASTSNDSACRGPLAKCPMGRPAFEGNGDETKLSEDREWRACPRIS